MHEKSRIFQKTRLIENFKDNEAAEYNGKEEENSVDECLGYDISIEESVEPSESSENPARHATVQTLEEGIIKYPPMTTSEKGACMNHTRYFSDQECLRI